MARDEVVEFALVRLDGPRRSRGPLALATWIVGLVAIVAIAVGGRVAAPASPEVGPDRSAESVVPVALADPHGPAATVTLLRPPAPGWEVTTPLLVIEGEVSGPVAYVLVTLEARGNRVIDRSTQPIGAHSGDRPPRAPRFSAAFELPALRPNGRMWVTVTAYGADDLPVGGTRRPVEIGPLLAFPGRVMVDGVPLIPGGVDRLLGPARTLEPYAG